MTGVMPDMEAGVVKVLKLLVLIPIAIVLLAFAIANRMIISISFDPFSDPGSSGVFIAAPLFVVLFLTLMVGVFVGGIATWFTQGSNRRKARVARDEAEHWQDEARRLREQNPAPGMSNRLMVR